MQVLPLYRYCLQLLDAQHTLKVDLATHDELHIEIGCLPSETESSRKVTCRAVSSSLGSTLSTH